MNGGSGERNTGRDAMIVIEDEAGVGVVIDTIVDIEGNIETEIEVVRVTHTEVLTRDDDILVHEVRIATDTKLHIDVGKTEAIPLHDQVEIVMVHHKLYIYFAASSHHPRHLASSHLKNFLGSRFPIPALFALPSKTNSDINFPVPGPF